MLGFLRSCTLSHTFYTIAGREDKEEGKLKTFYENRELTDQQGMIIQKARESHVPPPLKF